MTTKRKTKTKYTCRLCADHPVFDSLSAVRKHTWGAHPENYRRKPKTVVQMAAAPPAGEMTISQVIDKLDEQKNFLCNVIALLQGLRSQEAQQCRTA